MRFGGTLEYRGETPSLYVRPRSAIMIVQYNAFDRDVKFREPPRRYASPLEIPYCILLDEARDLSLIENTLV
jgi:hypothetical protein